MNKRNETEHKNKQNVTYDVQDQKTLNIHI